jgi:fucose 4-O-acetylase-like acetyltransferase
MADKTYSADLTSQAPGPATRLVSIDAARGVAILLVVVGHALEVLFVARPDGGFSLTAFYVWRSIYAFHMPLFFLLAGMAHGWDRVGSIHSAWTKALGLIILAMSWHLAGCVACAVHLAVLHAPSADYTNLLLTALRPLVVGAGFQQPSLWFLVSLGLVELAFTSCRRLPAPGRLALVAALAATLLLPRDVGAVWQAHSIVPGLAFFAAGAALRQRGWRWAALIAIPGKFITPALAAMNLGCALPSTHWCAAPGLAGRFAVSMALGRYGFLPLFFATAAVGSLTVLGAATLSEQTAPTRFLAEIGQRTLAIYLINGLALAFLNPVLRSVLPAEFDPLQVALLCACLVVGNIALAWPLSGPATRIRKLSEALAVRLVGARKPAASARPLEA